MAWVGSYAPGGIGRAGPLMDTLLPLLLGFLGPNLGEGSVQQEWALLFVEQEDGDLFITQLSVIWQSLNISLLP